jgi:hypothetical protein
MIQIESLSATKNPRSFIRRFISFPKSLYQRESNWIPWFDVDMRRILRKRHPFFTHSEGEAFLALGGVESAVGFWW